MVIRLALFVPRCFGAGFTKVALQEQTAWWTIHSSASAENKSKIAYLFQLAQVVAELLLELANLVLVGAHLYAHFLAPVCKILQICRLP